jgi:hypothetical protein
MGKITIPHLHWAVLQWYFKKNIDDCSKSYLFSNTFAAKGVLLFLRASA